MNVRRLLVSGIVCLMMTAMASGAKDLKVGASAPGLDIEDWVYGQETTIQPGNVYLISFWRQNCRECAEAADETTRLYNRYAPEGLEIIVVSTESKTVTKGAVETIGLEPTGYHIGTDRRSSTSRKWLDKAGYKDGFAAFLVDRQGKIQHIGDPTEEGYDKIVELTLDDRYDGKLRKQADPVLKAARQARRTKNYRLAFKHYDEVIEQNPRVFADIQIEKLRMYYEHLQDKEAGDAFARELITMYAADSTPLRWMAEYIATDPKIPSEMRDLDLALEAAKAASEAKGNQDPKAMATMALVYHERGEHAQAVRLQRRAWMTALPARKDEYRRQLDEYHQIAKQP